MQLTDNEMMEYRKNGFLYFPNLLSKREIEIINAELPSMLAPERREIVYESDEKTPRSIFNMHQYNPIYAKLVRHPKLIKPAMQLVANSVYVFQIIQNFKMPLKGEWWPWHQDYPTYHHDDGIPEPRMINVLIFLDEVNEFNGPLMLIPGSHQENFPVPEVTAKQASYKARYMDEENVASVMQKYHAIVAPKGPAGSVIFMHTNMVHGSAHNMSAWGRTVISLTLNAIENKSTGSRRPDYMAPPATTPVEPSDEYYIEKSI
jgi:ectoine hydroxylase